MDDIRWGIMGTGNIANKFAENIQSVKHARLVACASKDAQRAEEFKKRHGLESSYGDYEEMLRNRSIDAVYIATTHNFHYENALLCLRYGKHILCEKAFTVNAAQAKEIFEKAKVAGLFVMEAMWTRFLPAMRWMKEQIRSGAIGQPLNLINHFGFVCPKDADLRFFNRRLAGGGLLDLGIYSISIACHIFGNQPEKIISEARIGLTGVDEQASAILVYKDGRSANLSWSIVSNYENTIMVYGTKGHIILNQTSSPFKGKLVLYRTGQDGEEGVDKTVEFESLYANGFENEIQEATDRIRNGDLESPSIRWEDTIQIMEICDTMRAQWGLTYPEEKYETVSGKADPETGC